MWPRIKHTISVRLEQILAPIPSRDDGFGFRDGEIRGIIYNRKQQ